MFGLFDKKVSPNDLAMAMMGPYKDLLILIKAVNEDIEIPFAYEAGLYIATLGSLGIIHSGNKINGGIEDFVKTFHSRWLEILAKLNGNTVSPEDLRIKLFEILPAYTEVFMEALRVYDPENPSDKLVSLWWSIYSKSTGVINARFVVNGIKFAPNLMGLSIKVLETVKK